MHELLIIILIFNISANAPVDQIGCVRRAVATFVAWRRHFRSFANLAPLVRSPNTFGMRMFRLQLLCHASFISSHNTHTHTHTDCCTHMQTHRCCVFFFVRSTLTCVCVCVCASVCIVTYVPGLDDCTQQHYMFFIWDIPPLCEIHCVLLTAFAWLRE